jgi:hypothetical protein
VTVRLGRCPARGCPARWSDGRDGPCLEHRDDLLPVPAYWPDKPAAKRRTRKGEGTGQAVPDPDAQEGPQAVAAGEDMIDMLLRKYRPER